jgi:uncharacterized LabA/DUF88 family protein
MAKKIGIFVDVSNLYYCIGKKFNNRKLDYGKYMQYIKDLGQVEIAIAYGAQVKNQANKFLYALQKVGFKTKYRSPKAFVDNGTIRKKADCDLQIAVDIVNYINDIDMLVLGSADGDFTPIVKMAIENNVTVIILACHISGDLKRTASEFIEIPESLLENK